MRTPERLLREVVGMAFRFILFFALRPRLALVTIAAIAAIEISTTVRIFWLLLVGIALLFIGARLRFRGL